MEYFSTENRKYTYGGYEHLKIVLVKLNLLLPKPMMKRSNWLSNPELEKTNIYVGNRKKTKKLVAAVGFEPTPSK